MKDNPFVPLISKVFAIFPRFLFIENFPKYNMESISVLKHEA